MELIDDDVVDSKTEELKKDDKGYFGSLYESITGHHEVEEEEQEDNFDLGEEGIQ
eukprot:Pgem_evm1s10272